MKSKLPFIVVLGVTSLIALGIYRFFEYRTQLSDDFQQFQLYREEKMLSYAEIGRQLIREQKLSDLKNLMEVARKARDLDFYIVQYKEAAILTGAYGDHPEDLDIEYKVTEQMMRGPHVSTLTTQVDTDIKFTVGINRSFDRHFEIMLSQERITELQIVIGPLVIFLILAAYFFADIKVIIEKLRTRGRRDFKNQISKTIEAEILTGALTGYNENQKYLEQKTRILENQVLPSLKSEISSGLPPPYTFECTLVRTDINNFSFIFNNYDSETLMAVINDFFSEVSHIVARYDGLIHQFIGDEVVFYIKDRPQENSVLKALGALRDINQVAAQYHDFTQKEWGYSFTIKSSLAKGQLRFGHLVSGFTLAGAVLIETVRVLSQISEKDENTICFNQNYGRDLPPFCELTFYAEVSLKGYSENFKLSRYIRHQHITELLPNNSNDNLISLKYYRANSDLQKMLLFVCDRRHEMGEKSVMEIIDILRQIRVTSHESVYLKNEPDIIAQALFQLIQSLFKESMAEPEPADFENRAPVSSSEAKLLSASCTLLQNLLTQKEFEFYFESHVVPLLSHKNHRVVANIIDVIVYHRRENIDQIMKRFLNHSNVRIASNALVYEGSRHISDEVIQKLKNALASANTNVVAGALYAMGEIAQHHRRSDPVYFNSKVEFLSLVAQISDYQKSNDPMVLRQAAISLKKVS